MIKLFFRYCLILITYSLTLEAVHEEKPAMNVLFIVIDDLRPELGCYESEIVLSPNIDKFATEALLFNRAFCQVPVCGASRASMLTGVLPTKKRFVNYLARADKDAPNAITLPQAFKQAGYTTVSNGKIFHEREDSKEKSWTRTMMPELLHTTSFNPDTRKHLSKKGVGRFYESADVEDNAYLDGLIAEKTIDDLKILKKSGEPFFLACGFIRPHLPFYAPKKYWDMYDAAALPLAEFRERPVGSPRKLGSSKEYHSYFIPHEYKSDKELFHRTMRHGYLASTSYVDKLTGDVLNELKKLGLDENTIVVIWGDHGYHLGEHSFWGKHNLMFNATRVPLIVKIPGVTDGEKTSALVESIDIFPTLCQLAGIDTPDTVQGESFKKLFNNPEEGFKKTAYSRFKSGESVITDKDMIYIYFNNGDEMLSVLQRDSLEKKNHINNPGLADEIEQLRAGLKAKIELSNSFNK